MNRETLERATELANKIEGAKHAIHQTALLLALVERGDDVEFLLPTSEFSAEFRAITRRGKAVDSQSANISILKRYIKTHEDIMNKAQLEFDAL